MKDRQAGGAQCQPASVLAVLMLVAPDWLHQHSTPNLKSSVSVISATVTSISADFDGWSSVFNSEISCE